MTLKLRAAAILGISSLLLVGFHPAPADAQPTAVYACFNPSGLTRIVGPTEACRSNESRAQWSVEGPQGPVGLTGPQGLAGPQGPAGPQGALGAVGPQGSKGDTGTPGPQGSAGPQGTSGADGAAGPQGPQGPEGAQGPQGLVGQTGAAGLNWMGQWTANVLYSVKDAVQYGGSSYVAITSNIDPSFTPTNWSLFASRGATGATGSQGSPGNDGPWGLQGPQGPAGSTGPQGLQGPAGVPTAYVTRVPGQVVMSDQPSGNQVYSKTLYLDLPAGSYVVNGTMTFWQVQPASYTPAFIRCDIQGGTGATHPYTQFPPAVSFNPGYITGHMTTTLSTPGYVTMTCFFYAYNAVRAGGGTATIQEGTLSAIAVGQLIIQ